jgi:hypothetical protein
MDNRPVTCKTKYTGDNNFSHDSFLPSIHKGCEAGALPIILLRHVGLRHILLTTSLIRERNWLTATLLCANVKALPCSLIVMLRLAGIQVLLHILN